MKNAENNIPDYFRDLTGDDKVLIGKYRLCDRHEQQDILNSAKSMKQKSDKK